MTLIRATSSDDNCPMRTSVTLQDNQAVIYTDAPKENGGEGTYFSPTDLLAASLASCIATVLRLKAQQLGVVIEKIYVTVQKDMSTAVPRKVSHLACHIHCIGQMDDATKHILEMSVKNCPVHNSLHPDIIQIFQFDWEEP